MTSSEDTLVSAAADGTPANGGSLPGSISLDGRFVAFGSYATNLVTPDGNGSLLDLFVKDLQTGEVRRVSDASDGLPANDWSPWASLSADGRYVAFESDASNLVEGDTNGNGADVFVRDLLTSELRIVSNTEESTSASRSFRRPAISADGRFVAFDSSAPGHVAGDTNNTYDVFRADLSGAWGASEENSSASAAAYRNWLDFLTSELDDDRLKSKGRRSVPWDSATVCAAVDELFSQ
jgi:Tol biopolymer transport system component